MRSYQEFIHRKQKEYGNKFDSSELNTSCIRYFETGERVKVSLYGEELTGTIGVTTGWKPCFLLMRRSNAMGSSDCIGKEPKVLAVKRGKQYIPV